MNSSLFYVFLHIQKNLKCISMQAVLAYSIRGTAV